MSLTSHREDTHAEGDIVVGLYDSPSSRAALRWAAQHANATGAPLRAVHVLEWPIGLSESSQAGPATELHLPDRVVDPAYRRGMSYVFNDISPRPTWTLEFAEGMTAEVLVRHGEEAGLLVIGTREHHGMRRFQTGSISHYCISHATCPVVVVPVEYAQARATPYLTNLPPAHHQPTARTPRSDPTGGPTKPPRKASWAATDMIESSSADLPRPKPKRSPSAG